MRNYDFGRRLEEQQFERMACEIVGQRERIRFQTYRKGKDQGKDGLWYDEKGSIVLQAKCCRDFQSLFRSLKDEAEKVEKLDPDRYILVVSLPLSAGEAKKIRERFGPWLSKSEDLIDGNMLNGLLSDPDYRWIEKNFTGLWMPDGAVLEELLADAFQRGRRTRSAREWKKAIEACRSFVQTEVYDKASERLEKDHVVVVSGQPGMGKTTIARILALGFLQPDPKTEDGAKWQREGFCWALGLEEIDEAWKEDVRQVFVLDDYWGSVLHRERSRRESRMLSDLICQIEEADNKRLIITSREYIVQQAMDQNPELRDLIRERKLECVLKEYTNSEKAEILFAHLEAADLEWDYVESIFGCCDWLIKHRGYNPRVIEQFFKECHQEEYPPAEYAEELKEWIEYPERMWEGVFRELSEEAKVTALIAAITESPASLSDIRETYGCYVQNYAGKEAPKAFEACISELEETVVYTYFDEETEEIYLDFENPSVMDFLLDYLSRNREFYLPLLTECSIYYDQLLMLAESFKGLSRKSDERLETRCVEEFYTMPSRLPGLGIPGDRDGGWEEGSRFSERAFSLMRASSKKPDGRIWKFIHEYVETFFERLEEGRQGKEGEMPLIDGPDEMEDFAGLLSVCEASGMHFDGEVLTGEYWEHCMLYPEYRGFWELKETYPEAVQKIEDECRTYLKTHLKQILLDTLIEYGQREYWVAQDMLTDDIPWILREYGLYYTRKFKEEIRTITGRYNEGADIKVLGIYEEPHRLTPEETAYFRTKEQGYERLLGPLARETEFDTEEELRKQGFTEENQHLLYKALEEGNPWYVQEFLQDPGGFAVLKRIEEKGRQYFFRIFKSLDEFMAAVWLTIWEDMPGLVRDAASVCVDYAVETMGMSTPALSYKKMEAMDSYQKLDSRDKRAKEILFQYLFEQQGNWVHPRQDSVILYWLCRLVNYDEYFDWSFFPERCWMPMARKEDGEKEKYYLTFDGAANEEWIRLICLIMDEIAHEEFRQQYLLPRFVGFLSKMEEKDEERAYTFLKELKWELKVNSKRELCGASYFMMDIMMLAEIFKIADFWELDTRFSKEALQKLWECKNLCRTEGKDTWIKVYKADTELLEKTGTLELLESYLAKIEEYVGSEIYCHKSF